MAQPREGLQIVPGRGFASINYQWHPGWLGGRGNVRFRLDLGLVTQVTAHEWWAAAAVERWVQPGQRVRVCENPQVLQAAARARTPGPLLCLSGNPATVGLLVVDALVAAGADVRYHGDFDAAGAAIAGRVSTRGARPWRYSEQDYRAAVAATSAVQQLDLDGMVRPVPGAPGLAEAMNKLGVAVHEEGILDVLLSDLSEAHS